MYVFKFQYARDPVLRWVGHVSLEGDWEREDETYIRDTMLDVLRDINDFIMSRIPYSCRVCADRPDICWRPGLREFRLDPSNCVK